MPALLKAFLEQVFRPGFALICNGHRFPQKGLVGKSARVVTMGMPVFWYRWFFRAMACVDWSAASWVFVAGSRCARR